MTISQEEASTALDEIGTAGQRVREIRIYRHASPIFMVWGLVWLVANAVTDLWPDHAGMAWQIGVIAGTGMTVLLVIRQSLRDQRAFSYTQAERKAIGRRFSMLGTAMMAFFPAMFMVIGPLSAEQQNAFISLFWAFAYMAAGAWVGRRIFITGLVTAVAVLVGYRYLSDHYFLWMALVGGGSLLLGGFWMRKL